MQGDPKVDELMRPVLAAIKRHVKNITDIYNRAYEAVMNGMDVKTGKTYCAYCGAEYPLDDNAAAQVSEHIKTCEKHPMRAVEAELRKWQTGEIVGIEFVPKMFNELELKNARANARAEAAEAKVAALRAELIRAIDIYKDPAVAYANILNGRIVLPKFYVNITDDFGPVADLRAALAAANEDAERLASVLEDDGYPVKRLPMNAKRLSLAAHRARMGVSRDEGK